MKGKSPETVSNYRSLADHHLIPQLGAARLKRLTADELDMWMDERATCCLLARFASSTRSWSGPSGTPGPATRFGAMSPA